MKTNSTEFLTDFLEDNEALEQLFEIIGQHNDHMNLEAVQELLSIRNPTSDKAVVESIRMLGVNLDREIMSNRLSELRKLLNTLPDWRKVNGTVFWAEYVSMLLGTTFRTQRLYTTDYQQFFPTPLGTLIQDNGQWYKSTHVELEIDTQLEQQLNLTIQPKDVLAIKESLIQIGWTEQDALEWTYNHVGLSPANIDPTQAQARATLVQLRVSELFYEWAPVEEVLDRIQSTLNIGLILYCTAHTVVESTVRFIVGEPIRQSIQFLVPEFITGGQWTEIGVVLRYSDGSTDTQLAEVGSDKIIARDGLRIMFEEPPAVQKLTLDLKYDTTVQQVETRLFPIGITPDPDSLVLEIPTLYGSSTAKLRVYGMFGTSKRDLTDSGMVTFTTDVGLIDGNVITFPALVQDTEVTIGCVYSGQGDIEQKATVIAKRSVLQRVPVSIKLDVPDTVGQGQAIQLLSYVTYNDGQTLPVIPQYTTTARETRIVEDIFNSQVMKDDYYTTIVAEFGSPTSVKDVRQVRVRAHKSILADVDIVLPAVHERMYVTPKAMALYVKETATAEQIAARDPSIVVAYQPIIGTWFSSEDKASKIHALPDVRLSNGEFWAPLVDANTKYSIHINVNDTDMVRTFSRVFDILPTEYVPQQVDINHGRQIQSGSFINLPTVCLFNTGQTFAAAAALTVEYVPSESAKLEARDRTIKLRKEAIEQGLDPSPYDPENPDYTRWVTLELSDGPSNLYDPMLKRKQKIKQLYFVGDLHGAARVHIKYRFETHTVESYRDFQLVPVRALVTDLSLECPDLIFDSGRTFCRLLATYQDGSQAFVDGEYSAQWSSMAEDDYELVKFAPGIYTGMAIVIAVEGTEPKTVAEFKQMSVSKLPMFSDVGTLDQLRNTKYNGAVVQIGKLYEDETANLIARHYRMETYLPVVLALRPKTSLNNMTNARIVGPQNISSMVNIASYALSVTMRSNGIQKQVDGSYVDVAPKEWEEELTSDWSVLGQYVVEETASGPMLVPIDRDIVALDANGYLSVLENIQGAVKIQASYTCDAQNIVRTIMVNISKVNTYLREAQILGQDIVYDEMAMNPDFQTENGHWYIPYRMRVIFDSGNEIVTTNAQWSTGLDTDVSVSVDTLLGRLTVPEGQVSDGRIRINAVYSDTDPHTGQSETIEGTRLLTFKTNQTIIDMHVDVPPANIEPNADYQALAFYERRNAQTGSNSQPDSDLVQFNWQVIESVPGFNISPRGVFRFEANTQPQTVVVRCTITEQRTTMFRDLSITCLGVGWPQDLSISSFVNIRDNSEIQCTAWLGRSGTFDRQDVSSQVLWQTINVKGDTVSIPGITIDQKGKLTVGRLHSDTKFGVRATFIEGKARLSQMRFLTAYTSYPRFGTASFGVNTMALVEANFDQRLRTTSGGTFVLAPDSDQYGYFALHGSYGRAVFGFGSDSTGNVNKGWGGMDGAKWPITGDNGDFGPMMLRKSYDNLSEDILLYRTNNRAFGPAVITVRFEK